MTDIKRNNEDSTVYERITTIRMSRGECTAAIGAMESGEKIAEVILALVHVLRLLFAMPNLKPSFKPSFKH